MTDWIKDHIPLVYMGIGCICGWIMAMLRSGGFTTRNFQSRVTDATMCSMLTSALCYVSTVYFHLDDRLAIPIGTFIGFLVTDFIRICIKTFVKRKINED